MPRCCEVLDDTAERFVDRDVVRGAAAFQGSGHDLADLAQEVIVSDKASRFGTEEFLALSEDALAMIGEESRPGDDRLVDLGRPGATRSDRVDVSAVGDPGGAKDRLGRGGRRADR